jgi:putative transposase
MSQRKVIFANDEIYHVFNRGIASQPIFLTNRDYVKAFETLIYYQNTSLPVKFSLFLSQPKDYQAETLTKLKKKHDFWVEIIACCLMPNHFHLLLKQCKNSGISKFIANFSNSYTKYINTKTDRNGPMFQGRFKAVHITTDEQLLHVMRYIHLNPFTSYVVKNFQDLKQYKHSSLPEYLSLSDTSYFAKDIVLKNFKTRVAYEKFLFDQADYQRKLNQIKHLLIEK